MARCALAWLGLRDDDASFIITAIQDVPALVKYAWHLEQECDDKDDEITLLQEQIALLEAALGFTAGSITPNDDDRYNHDLEF